MILKDSWNDLGGKDMIDSFEKKWCEWSINNTIEWFEFVLKSKGLTANLNGVGNDYEIEDYSSDDEYEDEDNDDTDDTKQEMNKEIDLQILNHVYKACDLMLRKIFQY